MKLHEVLSLARECKGVSLRALSMQTGISNPLICQMESGKVKSPSFRNVVKLSRALGVSLKKLAETIPHKEVEVLSK